MYGGWCAGVVTGMIPLRVTLSNNLSVTAGALSPVTSVCPCLLGPAGTPTPDIAGEQCREAARVTPPG